MFFYHTNKCLILKRSKDCLKSKRFFKKNKIQKVNTKYIYNMYILGTKYLVHWKGFDESERTWEPYKNLKSV